jgi:uncharacterized protein YeaO (DUF488 family)
MTILTAKTKNIFAPIDDTADGIRVSIGRRWVGRRREKPNSIETLHIAYNIPALGHSPTLLDGYNNKTVSVPEYIETFNNEMRSNGEEVQFWIDKLTEEATRKNKPLTFLCKCENGKFCHRHLMKAIFLEGLDKYLARTEYDSIILKD